VRLPDLALASAACSVVISTLRPTSGSVPSPAFSMEVTRIPRVGSSPQTRWADATGAARARAPITSILRGGCVFHYVIRRMRGELARPIVKRNGAASEAMPVRDPCGKGAKDA
jgi:hypothetical protein